MASPRWLDEGEQHSWRAFVDVHRLLFFELERQLQRDAGLPHAYYEILVALSEAPDRRMRMSDLADATLSTRSRLSHAVTRLEALGWVVRRECESDRRGQLAVLTDAGFRVLEAAAPGHVEAVRTMLLDPLTPKEFETLGRLCRKVLDELQRPTMSMCDEPEEKPRR